MTVKTFKVDAEIRQDKVKKNKQKFASKFSNGYQIGSFLLKPFKFAKKNQKNQTGLIFLSLKLEMYIIISMYISLDILKRYHFQSYSN